MGTKMKPAAKPKVPAELKFELFAPGMTPLHRAGLGGLAATLRAMERRRKLGLISEDALPGHWSDGPPWTLESDRLTLHFGEPESAGEYLRRLFAFAFGIKDKLIDLPGMYRNELSRAVRAELQFGLTLTFLQFGPHRTLEQQTRLYFDVAGDGAAEVAVDLRACHSYLHQKAIVRLKLLDNKARVSWKATETPSAFNPGAVVRHNAFETATRIEELPPTSIAACFAIVGSLSLAVNRGVGVLLIPEFDDLRSFALSRPRMTPTTLRECRVAGASDAALQAQVRLRSKGELHRHGLLEIRAMQLRPTQWNEKQKTRVATFRVPPGQDERLRRFDVALRYLPPKLRSRTETVSQGRRSRTTETKPVWFWTDSIVRPLVADNLAADRTWYIGLTRLMATSDDSRTSNQKRITYEREQLHAMIHDKHSRMTEDDERALIDAIHRAIHMQRGRIKADVMGKNAPRRAKLPTPVTNRWERLMERLRLSLINAKTESQAREAIMMIFARSGGRVGIKELRDTTARDNVHRLLFHGDWQKARDLAMLAIVSFTAPAKKKSSRDTTESDQETRT